MTKARLLAVADEVASDIAAATYDCAFISGGRQYAPNKQIEELDTPLVTVAPAGIRTAPDNRADWLHEYDIDIGIQHRAGPNADAKSYFDNAMRLTEQIAEKYRGAAQRLTLAGCVLIAANYGGPTGLPFIPEHIEQFNQFTGVVRLTFQEWR